MRYVVQSTDITMNRQKYCNKYNPIHVGKIHSQTCRHTTAHVCTLTQTHTHTHAHTYDPMNVRAHPRATPASISGREEANWSICIPKPALHGSVCLQRSPTQNVYPQTKTNTRHSEWSEAFHWRGFTKHLLVNSLICTTVVPSEEASG